MEEEIVSAADAKREEILAVANNFIIGMLKTFGSLPVDRIHGMLSNYVEGFDLSIQDLLKYLNSLVKEDKLDGVSNVFSLKK